MKKTLQYILFIFLFTSGLYAQSDFDSSYLIVPAINVNASRLSVLKEDAPFNVQLLDRKYIENSNGNQLADVLKTANNVYIKSYGGNSSLKTISINGLGAEHTLILLNGVRLNSSQNAQFDLSLLPKESIESIEIIPSGSSASYGSDALSGVINIKTLSNEKTSSNNSLSSDVSAEVGSYNYQKYNLQISGMLNNSSLKLLYSNEKSNDDFEYYYFNGKENELKNRSNNSYSRDNFYFDYAYNRNDSRLSVISYYNVTERSIPGIETGSAPAFANQKDKNWNTVLNFEKKGNNTFKAAFNYQNNLANYSPYRNEVNYYKNLLYSVTASYLLNASKYKILFGGEFSAATIESDQLSGFRQRNNIAFYISNETRLADNILVLPSARIENISDIDKQVFTAKIGINYKPFSNNLLIFKSSAGNSFRAPTFNELYWKTGGNSNLIPEKSVSFEAGLLSVFRFITNNSIELTYTHINASDKIIWKPDNSIYWTPENVGNSLSNIFSLSLNSDYDISKKASVRFNFNYSANSSVKNNSDFQGDITYGKQLIYIPVNMFKININFDIYNFGFGAGSIFMGERYTDFANQNVMQPDFILDGNIFYNMNIGSINAGIKFELNNITNENYQVISGYPMPLRNYRFIITLKY